MIAILALVATETLGVGGKLVDPLGQHLAVDVTEHWHPDETLLALTRGRAIVEAMAGEVLGSDAPRALTGTVTHAKAVLAEAFTLRTAATPRSRGKNLPVRRDVTMFHRDLDRLSSGSKRAVHQRSTSSRASRPTPSTLPPHRVPSVRPKKKGASEIIECAPCQPEPTSRVTPPQAFLGGVPSAGSPSLGVYSRITILHCPS